VQGLVVRIAIDCDEVCPRPPQPGAHAGDGRSQVRGIGLHRQQALPGVEAGLEFGHGPVDIGASGVARIGILGRQRH
jgi:hypothetical protein